MCVATRNAEAQGQGCPRYDEAVHAELRQGADELAAEPEDEDDEDDGGESEGEDEDE